MPAQRTINKNLTDAYSTLEIRDFSGRLISEMDPQDMPPNGSPDCQNVKITQDGKLIGRDGYIVRIAALGATPDGIAFFYDSNGTRHVALWAGGNIYEVT